jgi:hypothetical protein
MPEAQWNTEIVPPPPLAEYAPYMDGPQATAAEQTAKTDWYTRLQDAVAACMAKRGFRYVPHPADFGSISTTGVGGFLLVVPVPVLDADRSIVAQHGYGVLAAPDPTAAGLGADPNVAYQQSLSPAEADAYSIALNGDYHVPTTDGSCSSEAIDAYPEPAGYSDRLSVFQAENGGVLHSLSATLRLGFLADLRVAALNREWEDCMNTKGYVFDEGATGYGPQAAMGLALRTRPDGTVAPSHAGEMVADIPPEERSLLGTEPERVVALADYDCRVATDYLNRLITIRVQMDNEFIAANYDALQRLENS